MSFGYPVFLELAGRRAVVIGAGAVRAGKVEGLLEAGADDVLVVAEGPARRLEELDADSRIRIRRRVWRAGDLDGAFLCVASSVEPVERDAIARAARERGVLVNVMDDVPNCDWAAPAIVRRGALVLAISTGGRSPALARRLRELLEERFGPAWSEVLRIVGEVREETLLRLPDIGERSRRWHQALDLDEAEGLVSAERGEELRARLRMRLVGSPREVRP